LIDDHLLCPDIRPLFYQLEEPFVDARVVGQLRVESCDEHSALPREHGMPVVLGKDLHLRPGLRDPRCADEDATERHRIAVDVEVSFEAVHLPPPRVSSDLEVDEAEMVSVQHDHPCTGSENPAAEATERLVETVEAHQPHEGRGLAARDHEPVQLRKLLGLSHLDYVRAETAQHRRVLAEVALHSEDADLHGEIVLGAKPARPCRVALRARGREASTRGRTPRT
jgi:hypothetical protein